MTTTSLSTVERDPWIDWCKAIASQLIVWHHLTIYGPMIRDATPALTPLWHFLAGDARMAVQIFLVTGGYLSAQALLSDGRFPASALLQGSAWRVWAGWVVQRYQRLMGLGVWAVVAAVLAAAWVRHILPDADTPATPSMPQLLANVLLLHDVLGFEALSAGLWYVAIDWQLFACLAALACGVERGRVLWVLAAVLIGLFGTNLLPGWDVAAPYFWGSYGLGVLAFWLRRASPTLQRLGLWGLAGVVALALLWAWRDRVALAAVTAGLLVVQPGAARLARSAWQPVMQWLAEVSYPVFLFHYSVCMVCGAWVGWMWPGHVLANTLGLLVTWLLCLLAGWGVMRAHARWRRARFSRVLRARLSFAQ